MGSALWNEHDLELIAGPNRRGKAGRSDPGRPHSEAARSSSPLDGGPAMSAVDGAPLSAEGSSSTHPWPVDGAPSTATSDAVSEPLTPLMGRRDEDRIFEAASGAASHPGETVPSSPLARPTDDLLSRPLRDLLVALKKLGVIE